MVRHNIMNRFSRVTYHTSRSTEINLRFAFFQKNFEIVYMRTAGKLSVAQLTKRSCSGGLESNAHETGDAPGTPAPTRSQLAQTKTQTLLRKK